VRPGPVTICIDADKPVSTQATDHCLPSLLKARQGKASHIAVEKEGIMLGRVGLDIHRPDHLVQLHKIEAGLGGLCYQAPSQFPTSAS
jgi:hypothetical protein